MSFSPALGLDIHRRKVVRIRGVAHGIALVVLLLLGVERKAGIFTEVGDDQHKNLNLAQLIRRSEVGRW